MVSVTLRNAVLTIAIVVMFLTPRCIHARKCGQCLCVRWSGIVSCFGKHVTELPRNITVHTKMTAFTHMDILNTSLTHISTEMLTDVFPNVQTLDIRHNSVLSCADVRAISKELAAQVSLITDCDTTGDPRGGEYNTPLKPPNYPAVGIKDTPPSDKRTVITLLLACVGWAGLPTFIIAVLSIYIKRRAWSTRAGLRGAATAL